MSKVKGFTHWWSTHQELYEVKGISKEVANTIWEAAINAVINELTN